MEHIIVFAVLILTLVLFAWGRLRHDFVALISLLILVVLGVIEGTDAFMGFGHPAVITVAAVLIVGKALEFSGLVDFIGKWVMKLGNNILLQVIVLCFIVAVASAFMNNVGALAIMMPIAIYMSRKSGYSPSKILMPLAFASLLGGMTTLIGTPPNIIIATFRATEKGEAFGMFDFSPAGGIVAIAGIIFVSLIGWRLLPKRKASKSENELFDMDDYITEVEVTEKSKLNGLKIIDIPEISKAEVQVLGLVRNEKRIHTPILYDSLMADDIIILEADADELKVFIEDTKVNLVGNKNFRIDAEGSEKITITEAVVMADSPIIGSSASSLKLGSHYGINLLAVARKEQKIYRRLDHVIFRTGDVLLLQGHEDGIFEIIKNFNCLPLARRNLRLTSKSRIPTALSIFGLSIAFVVAGLLPVQVAFSIAAVGMVLSGIMPLKEVYKSIDWPVIILLGAMLPVGAALETSGGAAIISSAIIDFGHNLPPWALLSILMIMTMLLSDIINNAATVVLMAPIAISIAQALGYSVDTFLMTVAVGASSTFLTPIGHQSNTLVMGPGGYKFTDYWKMGLPLDIIIIAIGVPAIMYFWPL